MNKNNRWRDRSYSQGYFVSHKGMVIEVESSFLAFSIEFENGDVISDTFAGMSQRKAMYERIEPDLYKALRSVVNQIQENKKLYGDYQFAKFPLGHARYQLSIHTPTEMCWIRYPEFVRSFRVEDIYLQNPELPIVEGGEVNDGFREALLNLGMKLPQTPYKPALRIT